MPRLIGKRIMLREWQAQDYHALCDWMNDAETVQWLGSSFWGAQSQQEIENFLHSHMESSYNTYHFVIADLKQENYLGHIDLLGVNWRMRQAEIAIVIGKKQNRNCGYGTEALQLIKEFAFHTLGLERIGLEVLDDNRPAVRAYQKAGFAIEGTKRHSFFCNGRFCNQIIMSCLREEWQG